MLILASNSPRRHQLLKQITEDFVIETSNIEETLDLSRGIKRAIEDLAYRKALTVFEHHPDDIVIGADTVVVLGEEILGKPHSKEEAFAMLTKLSNNTHIVITGVSILSKETSIDFSVITEVVFYHLSEEQIVDYIEECLPFDKAGAYAIQDKAALFVKEIHGDYYNIMGLPIARLSRELNLIKSLIEKA